MKLDELKAAYPDLTFEEIGPDESWDEDASGFCFVIEANIHARKGRATAMVDDLPAWPLPAIRWGSARCW